MHSYLSFSFFSNCPDWVRVHGHSRRKVSIMQSFDLWEQCITSRSQPDSLLYSDERERILHQEVALSARRTSSKCMSPRCHPCICCAIVALFSFCILVAVLKHLVDLWAHHRHRDYHLEFVRNVCNETISTHMRHLTIHPHVAGTPEDFATAGYLRSQFEQFGLQAHYADYEVLLSYPVHRSLGICDYDKKTEYELELKEAEIDEDPSTRDPRVVPTFHGFAPSGNVSGHVVYANYGRNEDFDHLHELGVNVSRAIVVARYGLQFRGQVVMNAQRRGALGVVLFSDPLDYAANGTQAVYPQSQWLPSTGVQRGTVSLGNGDLLTPGWPSVHSSERIDVKEIPVPKIPSLPISAHDASIIFQALGGPAAPTHWNGGLDVDCYRLGGGPSVFLNLQFVANLSVYPIRNVLAIIEGSEEPDRFVVLGNHRDAWTFGAVDPNSGTATLLELARGFGKLLKQGWKPRRTIVLGSWDAEEYGMVGSTEWVEHNGDLLGAHAVAYINVDCAVGGARFFGAATPQLDGLLKEVTKQVKDPERVYTTVFDSWVALSGNSAPKLARLGNGGSDYAPFLQHAGIPAMDMSFGYSFPVYHSLYDTYHWMKTFGDPLFRRHVASLGHHFSSILPYANKELVLDCSLLKAPSTAARLITILTFRIGMVGVTSIWGLVALRLADDYVLPFDYMSYAFELETYFEALEGSLEAASPPVAITIAPLQDSIEDLKKAAAQVFEEGKVLSALSRDASKVRICVLKRRALNDRLMLAERGFLEGNGLPRNAWFRHLVYGPAESNTDSFYTFPSVIDALNAAKDEHSWKEVQHEIWRVTRAVRRVVQILNGQLT